MSDELTRVIVQAISSYWSGKGTERKPPVVHKNDMASDIAAALAPLIVQREQRAFDRGYDKAMEGIEARVREARADECDQIADFVDKRWANGLFTDGEFMRAFARHYRHAEEACRG